MIKLLGSLLIIVSGTFIGKSLCDDLKQKIKFLDDFQKFLFYAKSEIEYRNSHPNSIVQTFKCNSNLNNFFEKCLLLTRNGENFPGAWEKTFHNCPFDENKIVLNFGRELGAYDVKNQILLCNLTIDNLNPILKKNKSCMLNNKKLFVTLGLCIGSIISILLF